MFAITRNNSAFLKGIAILLVMANHVIGKIGNTPGTILGAIGVSVFFILSGYGLNESFKKKGVSNFWGKKVKNIWLPYICISIPAMFVLGASAKDFLLDVTFLKPYYCYGWYLQILALFYVVFYFSARLKNELTYFLLWISVCILVYVFLYDVAQINALAFFLGIVISKYKAHKVVSGKILAICAFSCAMVGIMAFKFIPIENGLWLPRLQVVQISIALMLILMSVAFNAENKILMWVGAVSFELYIIHGWVIDPMPSLLYKDVLWVLPTVLILSWLYNLVWNRYIHKFIDTM